MRWTKTSLGFATLCLVELTSALSKEAAFEAQFLNVSEELKFADEKYGAYEIIEHRVSHQHCLIVELLARYRRTGLKYKAVPKLGEFCSCCY